MDQILSHSNVNRIIIIILGKYIFVYTKLTYILCEVISYVCAKLCEVNLAECLQ